MRNTNNFYSFSWDALTIYDSASSTSSSMMGKYCGDSIPPSHVSSSNEVLIYFQTSGDVTETGFKMEYNPLGNTSIQKTLNIMGIIIENCGSTLHFWFY